MWKQWVSVILPCFLLQNTNFSWISKSSTHKWNITRTHHWVSDKTSAVSTILHFIWLKRHLLISWIFLKTRKLCTLTGMLPNFIHRAMRFCRWKTWQYQAYRLLKLLRWYRNEYACLWIASHEFDKYGNWIFRMRIRKCAFLQIRSKIEFRCRFI